MPRLVGSSIFCTLRKNWVVSSGFLASLRSWFCTSRGSELLFSMSFMRAGRSWVSRSLLQVAKMDLLRRFAGRHPVASSLKPNMRSDAAPPPTASCVSQPISQPRCDGPTRPRRSSAHPLDTTLSHRPQQSGRCLFLSRSTPPAACSARRAAKVPQSECPLVVSRG